jgi:WD40 repeat protein/tetratricopeptide (TPR) repeat protein
MISIKLLEQIGEGGFGVVFMTEQQQPIRRKVALKLIKPGMDTRQVIARFEAERQALALMDHLNIAKVLDAGQTSSGRPYFVMDLVKGLPITEFCYQAKLPIRERLELFLSVCQAVQHAHQKGIIHRDIKPSNVLVTLHEGAPLAKVIDFGIAKALGQQLTDKTVYTGFAQMIGTPLYMSPEQAALSNDDVDTRSDIYSLGVLLYELLTGTTPFDRERLHQAGYDELRRIIREEEPPRPSTRISSMGEAATTISTQRQSDPKRLGQFFRAELDWIVMKCLEKDRNRRYETANGLARDIQRYLNDEPVQACPPSAGYRLKKFMRKYQRVVLTAAALVGLLVAGTAVSTWQATRATRAMAVADQERARALGRLWESLRDRARAMRMSRRPGQRIESLQSIKEAMQLPLPPGHSLDELRTEAVAALALPDIEVEREWQGGLTPGTVNLTFDGNLKHYARLAEDGTVTVRRISDDQEIARWKEDTAGDSWPERSHWFSPDGRYLAVYHGGSKQVVVRRLDGPEPAVCYSGEKATGTVDFTPDSTKMAYVLTDTRIPVVDLASGQARYLPPTGVEQGPIELAPDGRRFAIQVNRAGKRAVEVRDLATGQVEVSLPHPAGGVAFNGWHPDGRTLATCSDDRLIRLWDVPSGKLLRTLEGHKRDGIHCSFDSTGQRLLSNDWNAVLRLWEPSSGRQLLSFPAGGYNVLRVSPDDRLAVTKIGDASKLQLLHLHGNREYQTIAVGCREISMVSVHPDGRLLVVGGTDGNLVLVDMVAGLRVEGSAVPGERNTFWESSAALLSRDPSGVLRWRLHVDRGDTDHYRLGPPQRLLGGGGAEHWSASLDGQTIAISNYDRGAVVLHRGPPQRTVRLGPQQDVRQCAVSPNGCWVATGSFTNTDGFGVKVWEAATGCLVKALTLTGSDVAFSPDSRLLLTTGGGCRLWNVGTWTEGPAIGGPTACFSPDSRLLAVEDSPGAIRLVSTDNGKLVVRLESPEQTRLIPRCFTPDSTSLIAVGVDTEALHIWDLREIRRGLADLGLDWDEPDYPAAGGPTKAPPLQVTVDTGDLIAREKYSLVLAFFPFNAEAYYQRGLAYTRLGRREEAFNDFNLAVTLNPDHAEALYQRGLLYAQRGSAREAVADFTAALTLNPELGRAYAERGHIYFGLNDWSKAAADYSEAIARQAGDALIWHRRAHAYENLGDYGRAFADFSKAIELSSQEAGFWYCRGQAYARRMAWQLAIKDLSKVIDLQPDRPEAWKDRADAYAHLGELDQSARDYEKFFSLRPGDAKAYNDFAWSLATGPDLKLRNPTYAVQLAEKAVKLAPKEGNHWNTLGVAHYRAGHWKDAIEALNKSMELMKGQMESFDTLFVAMAYWQLDEKEKGRQWYDRAVQWMDKNQKALHKPHQEELHRFRSEAAELLGIKE